MAENKPKKRWRVYFYIPTEDGKGRQLVSGVYETNHWTMKCGSGGLASLALKEDNDGNYIVLFAPGEWNRIERAKDNEPLVSKGPYR